MHDFIDIQLNSEFTSTNPKIDSQLPTNSAQLITAEKLRGVLHNLTQETADKLDDLVEAINDSLLAGELGIEQSITSATNKINKQVENINEQIAIIDEESSQLNNDIGKIGDAIGYESLNLKTEASKAMHTTGTIINGSGVVTSIANGEMWKFNYEDWALIEANVGSTTADTCTISFFRSYYKDTPSGFISGKKVGELNKAAWHYAVVPEGTKTVVISNVSTVTTTPFAHFIGRKQIDKTTTAEYLNIPQYIYNYAPNWFIEDGFTEPTIPTGSLADLGFANRLGFKSIYANVKTTSDGQYIIINHKELTFGNQFGSATSSTSDSVIQQSSIHSVTYQWIKDNVVYRSSNAGYKTYPPTLEEYCKEAKKFGMTLFLDAPVEALSIAANILGERNIVYITDDKLIREKFAGCVNIVENGSSGYGQILDDARAIGHPCIVELGANQYNLLKNSNRIGTLTDALHAEGYLIKASKDIENLIGNEYFDLIQTGYKFVPGEANYKVVDNFFSENYPKGGTISNGVITLNADESCSFTGTEKIVGKIYIRCRYEGNLQFTTTQSDAQFTKLNDGSESVEAFGYVFGRIPFFTLRSFGQTKIYELDVRISKM